MSGTQKWLKKGALVEVYTDNEWWDATCILFNKNFVRVHYVGGMRPTPRRAVAVVCSRFSGAVPMRVPRELSSSELFAVSSTLARRGARLGTALPCIGREMANAQSIPFVAFDSLR